MIWLIVAIASVLFAASANIGKAEVSKASAGVLLFILQVSLIAIAISLLLGVN